MASLMFLDTTLFSSTYSVTLFNEHHSFIQTTLLKKLLEIVEDWILIIYEISDEIRTIRIVLLYYLEHSVFLVEHDNIVQLVFLTEGYVWSQKTPTRHQFY